MKIKWLYVLIICLIFSTGFDAVSTADYMHCYHYDEKGFMQAVENAVSYNAPGRIIAASSPHFLPVMSFTAGVLSAVMEQGDVETIVLVGPNHGGQGMSIIVGDAGWDTPFGYIEADRETAEIVIKAPGLRGRVGTDRVKLESDHSLSTLTPFIKYYLPDVEIVTIMLSRGCGLAELEILAKIIHELSLAKNVFLLASVDFSHYLDIYEIALHDEITQALITDGDIAELKRLDNGYMDSPESMILLMLYAEYFAGAAATHADGVIMPESSVSRNIGYSYHTYLFTYACE